MDGGTGFSQRLVTGTIRFQRQDRLTGKHDGAELRSGRALIRTVSALADDTGIGSEPITMIPIGQIGFQSGAVRIRLWKGYRKSSPLVRAW